MRRYAGRGIGILLGAPAGLAGAIFGFLVGTLVDQFVHDSLWDISYRRYLTEPRREKQNERAVFYATGTLLAIIGAARNDDYGSVVATIRWPGQPQRRRNDAQTGMDQERYYRRARTWHALPEYTAIISDLAVRYGQPESEHQVPAAIFQLVEVLLAVECSTTEGMSQHGRTVVTQLAKAAGLRSEDVTALEERYGGLDREACRLLGVAPTVGRDEVKRVYRRLASQMHPDTGIVLDTHQRNEMEGAFLRIRDAYDRLIAQIDAREGKNRHDVSL